MFRQQFISTYYFVWDNYEIISELHSWYTVWFLIHFHKEDLTEYPNYILLLGMNTPPMWNDETQLQREIWSCVSETAKSKLGSVPLRVFASLVTDQQAR